MAKKRKSKFGTKLIIGIVGLSIITAIVLMAGILPEQQTVLGYEDVYYPQYGRMECKLADANYNLYERTNINEPSTVTCGVGMNGYTNFCKYQVKFKGSSWYSIFNGIKFEQCNNAGSCTEISGLVPIKDSYFTVVEILLDANRDGYIDTQDSQVRSTIKITPKTGWFSNTVYDIRVLGNAYFLEDIQGNNYGTTYPEGCSLSQISTQAHEINTQSIRFNYQDSQQQVPFGRTINYVWGMTRGITSNVISHNGQTVYIERTGFYSPIKTADDGSYKYVDWQTQIPDSTIQCVPSNVYICNADATLRPTPSQDIDGQDCSLIRGVNPNDFFKKSETQCCRYNCVNGKIQTSECQSCAVCGQGYIYDSQTNQCKKVGDTGTGNTDKPNDSDLIWIAIIIIVVIVALILMTGKKKPQQSYQQPMQPIIIR